MDGFHFNIVVSH